MIDMTRRSVALSVALASIAILWGCTPGALVDDTSAETPPEQVSEPSSEDYKNVLRWATASEVDNFGYDLYRGDSEEGPFKRITEQPLLGAGTTDETSQYEFIDTDIDPHKPYWYYVESISKAGKRERFTPIIKKEAQLK